MHARRSTASTVAWRTSCTTSRKRNWQQSANWSSRALTPSRLRVTRGRCATATSRSKIAPSRLRNCGPKRRRVRTTRAFLSASTMRSRTHRKQRASRPRIWRGPCRASTASTSKGRKIRLITRRATQRVRPAPRASGNSSTARRLTSSAAPRSRARPGLTRRPCPTIRSRRCVTIPT